jgi:hypothetical protein
MSQKAVTFNSHPNKYYNDVDKNIFLLYYMDDLGEGCYFLFLNLGLIMKSKLFNAFYESSYNELYPIVQQTEYFNHLVSRLNIFTTPAKRHLLVQQKIEYILKNFDMDFVKVIIDDKAKSPNYTKNKEMIFPAHNEEKNWFDVVYLISEVIMIDFIGIKKSYDKLFASIYKDVLSKVYKIEAHNITAMFEKIGVADSLSYEMIYDSYINKDAWTLIYDRYAIILNDMKKEENDIMVKYFFEKDAENITVCTLRNKKVKVIVSSV